MFISKSGPGIAAVLSDRQRQDLRWLGQSSGNLRWRRNENELQPGNKDEAGEGSVFVDRLPERCVVAQQVR